MIGHHPLEIGHADHPHHRLGHRLGVGVVGGRVQQRHVAEGRAGVDHRQRELAAVGAAAIQTDPAVGDQVHSVTGIER